MSEINFCPYCDAPSHKILLCKGDIFFCKECSRFFKLKEVNLKCSKCDSENIVKSDFPSSTGEAAFPPPGDIAVPGEAGFVGSAANFWESAFSKSSCD